MSKRMLNTSVANLTIYYCGQCPLRTTAFRRERISIADEYPPRFTSVIDYHKCTKTGRRVQFTAIDERCPLPVADNIEPQRKAEKSGGMLPTESTEISEGRGR